MFIKKFAESDFEDSFKLNLDTIDNHEKLSKSQYLNHAITFTRLAADLLDEIGKADESIDLTNILETLAGNSEKNHESEPGEETVLTDSTGRKFIDTALEGTDSSQKMLHHMKHTGLPFGNHSSPPKMIILHDLKNVEAKEHDSNHGCKTCGQCENCCNCSNCNYCGDKMTDDALFCSQLCTDKAEDSGMVYDCMDSDDSEEDLEEELEDAMDESDEESDSSPEKDMMLETNENPNDFYDLGAIMAEEQEENGEANLLSAVLAMEDELPLEEVEEFSLGYLEFCKCSLEEALEQFKEVHQFLLENDYEPRYTLEEVEELLTDDESSDDPTDDLEEELSSITSDEEMDEVYDDSDEDDEYEVSEDDLDEEEEDLSDEDEDEEEDDDLDVNDARSKKKCSGWKKSPVGSPRQKAFCKRHCGMKKKLTSKKVADDPDSCINQGLRRWKCRCN